MEIKDKIELQQSDIIKKSLILLGFLLLFAILSVPFYFLMTAGAKDVTNEKRVEKGVNDPAFVENASDTVYEEDATQVPSDETFPGIDGYYGGEIDPNTGLPYDTGASNTVSKGSGDKVIRLNGFAFFIGMILILILYIAYFEIVLKKQFRVLMQGERVSLIASLVAFLIFILAEIFEVFLIPNYLVETSVIFKGIPWGIAYAIPIFLAFFTLIATWVDANVNHTVYIENVAFHYAQFGRGGRNLILIPGLSMKTVEGQGLALAWQFRDFFQDYTVYVMDKRDDVKEDVTLRELAEDIYAVADYIGLVGADVVGVSQGGMIAQYFAIDHPEFVNKLVLAVTASKMNDSIKAYVNYCVVQAQRGDMEAIMIDSFEKDFSQEYTKSFKPILPLMAKLSVPKSNTRFIRLARAINSLDTYEELDKITCPVFVIGAARDRIVTVEASEEIVEKLNCKKYIYRNLGHGTYSEAKDFNEKIYRFLMKS